MLDLEGQITLTLEWSWARSPSLAWPSYKNILTPTVGHDETLLVALCFTLFISMTMPSRNMTGTSRNSGGEPTPDDQISDGMDGGYEEGDGVHAGYKEGECGS